MRTTPIFALLLVAAALPADAQTARSRQREAEVRERAERARVMTFPRMLEATRAPRAVLGLSTTTSGDLRDTLGVLVADVTADGPAAKAGIREGARLQAIDGVNLRVSAADADDPMLAGIGMRRLTRELEKHKAGDEVELRVADGGTRTVRVRLADRDSLFRARVAGARGTGPLGALRATMANRAALGIQIGSSGSRRDTLGVLVIGADDEGPAAKAGIIEGTRIAAINGVDLRVGRDDVEDGMVANARVQRLHRTLQDVKPGEEVELRVWQNGQFRTTRVRTVPSDSLPRRRSTFIIGDRLMGPEGMPMLPSMVGPRGPRELFVEPSRAPQVRYRVRSTPSRLMERTPLHLEFAPEFAPEFRRELRRELRPEFDGEIRTLLEGAFREARGAVARTALRDTLEVRRTHH